MPKQGQNQGWDHVWGSPKALLLATAQAIRFTSIKSWMWAQMAFSSFFSPSSENWPCHRMPQILFQAKCRIFLLQKLPNLADFSKIGLILTDYSWFYLAPFSWTSCIKIWGILRHGQCPDEGEEMMKMPFGGQSSFLCRST